MEKGTSRDAWSDETVEAALAAQGIALAPSRAERIARAQSALLRSAAADPLLGSLAFEADPSSFGRALLQCK